jgi:hypothetical protein
MGGLPVRPVTNPLRMGPDGLELAKGAPRDSAFAFMKR